MLVAPRPTESLENSGSPSTHGRLAERIEETLQLMDRRGYGVPLDAFARLLYKGPEPAAAVEAALALVPDALVVDGIVVRRDRAAAVGEMLVRQETHRQHSAQAQAIAKDFAHRLSASCPLVRCISVTGSTASGGFDPRDDIDLNLVVRDGSKYTVYLWALALSAVTSLRHRRKPTDEMSSLPFLPKVICVNVVWVEAQVRPFVRQDKWLAYELLMHRPLVGAAYWEGTLVQNPWLGNHFPQVFSEEWGPGPGGEPPALATRPGAAFFGWLGRHPRALAVVERASRALVIGLHKAVSLTRTRKEQAREREAFVNLVKRPYSVYDIPGRAEDVPLAALAMR